MTYRSCLAETFAIKETFGTKPIYDGKSLVEIYLLLSYSLDALYWR